MGDGSKNQIPAVDAYSWQGEGSFPGADAWATDTLKPGDKLVQLDFPRETADTHTSSKFFTTYEELQKHIDPKTGLVDTAALSERLQVAAYRPPDGDEFNHSPKVSIYEVTDDVEVASAKVTDNPTFGKGGAQQYYTELEKDGILKNPDTGEGFLKKVGEIESYNTKPRLPIYDELKNVPNSEIDDIVEKYHDEFIDALEQVNTPEANKVADDMIERQAFSETAREIKDNPEAIKAIEIPDANATALDLDAKILSQVERIQAEALGHGADKQRGVMSEADARNADEVLSDPKVKGFSVDPDLETQHYYSKAQNAIVTLDKDGTVSLERGTPERPAGHIFHDRLQDAAERFPDFHEGRLPARITGGVSGVAEAVTDMNKTGVWKTLGNAAEDGGKFLGKASKLLGPVGVGAATYEASVLEAKAREFEEYGALSEDAVTQYDLILVGHVGQATVDPTMVGGEALTKAAFEKWADHHEISDEMKAELAPGLLIDIVGKSGQKIYDTYEDVKGYGEELAREVTEGLKDIVGMPSHRDMFDELDPYSTPQKSFSEDFKDLFGIPSMSPSFGSGAWQEGALQLNGNEQMMGDATVKHASFSEADTSQNSGQSSGVVTLEDAIIMLTEDQKTLNASAESGHSSPVLEALNHPDAVHMFQNLHQHGLETLRADITPDMSTEDRATELLLAGREATAQAGIPMPEEQRELETTQELNNNYEDDYSYSV